ncbi:MAG: proton-conducting transporter transmembrane domain-containing protein, partial [Terriglobales bacterium]
MDALNHTIISWTLLLPLLGALGIVLAPSERVVRWLAAIATAATFLVSLHLPFHFDAQQGGMQFIQNLPWIQSLDIHYFVAVDGISLWLVVLTTLLTFFGVLVSWRAIHYRVKFFYALLLILETGMLGVFVGLDLMLFYTFWEVALVPMALLIGIWGHERRIYAAVKFFLYTLAGSVLMLASIIWLHTLTGSFNYLEIQRQLA